MLRSGIYEIRNLLNDKRYIGSAVNLARRFRQHRAALRAGRHHNKHLQFAWNKHGEQNFEFRAFMTCVPEELLVWEQNAMDLMAPEYNAAPRAGSTLGFNLAPETRAKIAAKAIGRKRSRESVEAGAAKVRGIKRQPEFCERLKGNRHAIGLKHTDEWKRANSERNRGVKRPKSPEYRAKIAAALKGIPHSPERRAKQAAGQLGTKRGPYKLDPAKAAQRKAAGKALAAIINQRRWGSGSSA